MAGFEVIVRPMILPAIRPAPRPSVLPAEADPEKGLAVIRGQSAKTIELPYSYSLTWSIAVPHETEREVDVARIYQKKDDGGDGGSVNRDNYVDVEAARRIRMSEPGGEKDYFYTPVEPSENVEILQKRLVKRPHQ